MSKLAPRTFVIQWDVHAWVGAIASIVLACMFFGAIFAVFFDALEIWEEPALHHAPAEDRRTDWDAIAARAGGPPEQGGRIAIAVVAGTRFVHASLHTPGVPEPRVVWIDPASTTVIPERTRLARELYLLHYLERVPGGMRLAGVLAIAMLVATLSGLAITWKDLRRVLRVRALAGPRVASSDAHKAIGILGIPFVLFVSWSGALLAFADPLDETFRTVVHGGSIERMSEATGRWLPPRASGEAIEMPPLRRLVERARQELGEPREPEYVDVRLWGDASAFARVYFDHGGFGRQPYVVLRARDLAVLDSSARPEAPVRAVDRVLHDLHFAGYGGLALRILWALAALGGCVVILTGNVVWILRRDPERARASTRVLERLSIAVPAGEAIAVGAYFLANRALPGSLEGRADAEFAIFLGTWIAVAIAGAIARAPRALAWIACATYAAPAAIDLAVRPASLAVPAVAIGDGLLASLALASAAIAIALARTRRRA